MIENLADMVKDHKIETKEPTEKDLDVTVDKKVIVTASGNKFDISTSNLSEWFLKNEENFEDIKHIKVKLTGVDEKKNLIFTIPQQNSKTERKLQVIEGSDKIIVLNAEAEKFEVYDNGSFKTVYKEKDGITLKTYGIRTGIIAVQCAVIDGYNIPYSIEKLNKKTVKGFNLSKTNSITSEKLKEETDLENIYLQYRQIQKHSKNMKTREDVVKWMLNKQESIKDVNHHLKIDELIIQLFS